MLNPYINASFCSSCGVCEMYACPQSLAPRTLLADMKGGLRKAGIRPPQGVQPVPVKESREYRKVPEERLMARLGLTKYDKDAPMDETLVEIPKVKILLEPAYRSTCSGNCKGWRSGDKRSDDRCTCPGLKCWHPCNHLR